MKPAERAVLVLIVVAVGLALRWGFVATAHQQNPLRADAGHYAQYAHNLLEHGVYSFAERVPPPPDSFRSPGYPVFLAAVRGIAGESWLRVAWALQVALGAATVLLAYGLARRFLPFVPALIGTALCALSPHLVVSPAFVLTETLTTFVLTLGLWMFAAAYDAGRTVRFGLAALVLGLAVLCNEALAFVPLVLAWPLLRASGFGRALVFVAIALTPLLVWSARNQSADLAHRGSERVIASISHGTYPGMVHEDPRYFGFPYQEDPAQPAFGSSWENLYEVFTARAAADPWRYASWYLLEKPVWLWGWALVQGTDVYVYQVGNSPYERQAVMRGTWWVMRALHWPVMILAAAAALVLVWNPRRRFGVLPQSLGLIAVVGTLAYLPVIPDPRYLQPFRPVLFVLAGAAVLAVVRLSAARRRADVSHPRGQAAGEPVEVAQAK